MTDPIDDRSIIALWPTTSSLPSIPDISVQKQGLWEKVKRQLIRGIPLALPRALCTKWSPVHCYFAVFADVHSFQDNHRLITGGGGDDEQRQSEHDVIPIFWCKGPSISSMGLQPSLSTLWVKCANTLCRDWIFKCWGMTSTSNFFFQGYTHWWFCLCYMGRTNWF